jgi:hypothetical protein
MAWAIKYKLGRGYFKEWTGIGLAMGATKKTAKRFKTKREAEEEIARFPILVGPVSEAVKV